MKKYIMYYYNLDVKNITYENNRYFVDDDKRKYIFEQCKSFAFLKCYDNLINQLGIDSIKCFFKIVKNVSGNLITYINGAPYMLLYCDIGDITKNISVEDIENNINKNINIQGLNSIVRYPWDLLWEKKIDYIENWFIQKKQLYKNEMGTIWFLIGLGESAIAYFKNAQKKREELIAALALQHNRVSVNMKLYDYYDLNNIVIDHSSRDLSEYIKSSIIQNKFNLMTIDKWLSKLNYKKEWVQILYARLLFPSYFFDDIENMMSNDKNWKVNIKNIEKKLNFWCEKLRKIGDYLNKKYNIEIIKWI